MVPCSTLMTALGGQASYSEGGVITCTVGDTALSFTLGQKTVTATANGKTETIQMDVPCYYKGGRTYVPVSFFAQALGYDVLWDSTSRSAVLVDKSALIDEIDKNFTVLNAALQKVQSDPTKNYKSTATYDIAMDTEVYLCSANALAETGELVNIDGAGNRVASTLFGHRKIYFVVGANKLCPTYEDAVFRARNVAAPQRARQLGAKTPCAVHADRCYDCKSPGRICRGLVTLWGPMAEKKL